MIKRLIVDENYNLVDTETGEWLDDTQVFDLANRLADEIKELEIEYRRLARFLMKNGYTISDYLDYCEENEFK